MSSKKWRLTVVALISIVVVLAGYNYRLLYTKAYPSFRAFEGYRIAWGITDYEKMEANKFLIRFSSEEADTAEALFDIVEEYGALVLDFFKHQRAQSVTVLLFPNEEKLKGLLRIPQDQSAMGAYAGGKIHLLSPYYFHEYDMLVNVFVHELAHLVVDDIARGNYPIWFTEGSALYLEYALLDYEWGAEIEAMDIYSVEDLTHRFSQLDEYWAYRQSLLLIKGLIEEHGRDKYLKLLDILGRGVYFDTAFKEAFGLKLSEIQKYLGPSSYY